MLGKDVKGRTCATDAVHVNDGGRITLLNVLILLSLLVLPVISLQRRAADFRWVGALQGKFTAVLKPLAVQALGCGGPIRVVTAPAQAKA